MTATTFQPQRALGTQSLSASADVLASRLAINAAEANSRLKAVADYLGISETELAELAVCRLDTFAD